VIAKRPSASACCSNKETGESDAAHHAATVVRALWLLRVNPRRLGSLMSVPDGLAQLPGPILSAREIEIIELVATGLTNQEIALRLMISKRTVDNHVSNIFSKTGAKNRVALLNWAMDHGKICRDGFNCCNLP